MELSQTIQRDFNKIFRLEDVEMPYSLLDMLHIHTSSSKKDDMYVYLHDALYYSFNNSSMFMSTYKETGVPVSYTTADIYIFSKKTKEPVQQKIIKEATDKKTYHVVNEKGKYILLAKKKGAYDVLQKKVIENPTKKTTTRFIVYKVMFQDTLVFVLYDIKKNTLDIMFSSTIHGKVITDVKKFRRRLMVNIKKIFTGEQFDKSICSVYHFGYHVTTSNDVLYSYIWFTLTLKYFSPSVDVAKLKEYITALTFAQRHNMIIHWVNFMTKYSKHLTNVEMDTFLIEELVHTKTKKKITKQSTTKSTTDKPQQGGGLGTIRINDNKKVTSYIRQLFTIV
jgi:hypothetical protein